jgi:F-type H+-transporting ATPase subunit epsilon
MLHLRILTTDSTVFNGTADEVTVPTETGIIGVLGGHTPLVTIITSGKMIVKREGEIDTYTISGGVLEVRPGSQVVVLASGIEVDVVA